MENSIKSFRKKQNLTQSELAEALGVSRQTIHMIENSNYNPSLELAFRLSNFFNTHIENIFKLPKDTSEHLHHLRSYR